MRRNYYRNQPLLVRSPDPLPRWLRLTIMWSVVAVGLVVLSRAITVAGIGDAGPPPMVTAEGLPLAVQPAAAPASSLVATAAVSPTAGAGPAASPVPRSFAAPVVKARKVATAPAARPAIMPSARDDYRRAVADYAAQERSAGYRWARENRVTVGDYCRATREQRNGDFMQGCMAYLEEAGD